jgi:hypothetical protein
MQYFSMRYTGRLTEGGIEASVGSRADSYDNALAESIIGLFKTEVIQRSVPPRTVGKSVTAHRPAGRASITRRSSSSSSAASSGCRRSPGTRCALARIVRGRFCGGISPRLMAGSGRSAFRRSETE